MFPLHPSPTEISKGSLTPSSRRRYHPPPHLLCLRLPLRLPHLVLLESGHDHRGVRQDILNVFGSCSMVRLAPLQEVCSFRRTLRPVPEVDYPRMRKRLFTRLRRAFDLATKAG